jgi:membrane-associated phospholipid phosphatase
MNVVDPPLPPVAARWRRSLQRRLDPEERFGIRVTLLAIGLILLALPFGFLLNQVSSHGSLVHADADAAAHLHAWVVHSPGRVRVLRDITFFGSDVWLFGLVAVTVLFLASRVRIRLVVFLVATSALGSAIDTAVKSVVSRPRPVFIDPVLLAPGKSFPSGHAMSSTVVYGALLLVLIPFVPMAWRRVVIAGAVGLVVAIGFTRLALGVHYLTDVLGGYVLGLAWLSLSTAAFSVWRREQSGRPTDPLAGLEPEIAGTSPNGSPQV